MRYLIVIAFLLLSFISHAADTRFDEGVEAYQNNNYQQAFAIFLPLAQAGNVDAQLSVGTMYDRGQGVEQDSQEALKWYKLAADQGDNIAKSLLKTLFNSSAGPIEYEESVHGTDNTTTAHVNTIELISATLSREETLNQILNQSRLSVLTATEKPSSFVKTSEKALFSSATYQKIESWLKNSFIYLAGFIGLVIIGFVLFHAFKRKKPAKKAPIFYTFTEDEGKEEIVEDHIVDEVSEDSVIEEISAIYFEPSPTHTETKEERVTNDVDHNEEKTLEKETLFEYCYNNHAYDEEKLNENPLTKIQRRRYKGSFMEYCYEECYH